MLRTKLLPGELGWSVQSVHNLVDYQKAANGKYYLIGYKPGTPFSYRLISLDPATKEFAKVADLDFQAGSVFMPVVNGNVITVVSVDYPNGKAAMNIQYFDVTGVAKKGKDTAEFDVNGNYFGPDIQHSRILGKANTLSLEAQPETISRPHRRPAPGKPTSLGKQR